MPSAEKLARETPGNPVFAGDLPRTPFAHGEIVSGDKFTWIKDTGRGATEISDLGWNSFPGSFYIKSQKTGDVRLFMRCLEITIGEGPDKECGGFEYTSTGGRITVSVFND